MGNFKGAIAAIDLANSQDPNLEIVGQSKQPKELIYSQRMTACLMDFCSEASIPLQIAARAQHICRWEVPRASYPLGKVGYHKWRNSLKQFHADKTETILKKNNFEENVIERVKFLIQKKKLQSDPETQTLEDVICLVFLADYLLPFAVKHPDDKVISILQKTWAKMSSKGQEAALKLPLESKSLAIIKKALSN